MKRLPKNPLPIPLKGCYLAGGAILSVATKTDISDYDIYPKSKKEMIDIFFHLEDSNCFIVNFSDRAVTWKCNDIINDMGERAIFQVMTFEEFKSPEQIFEYFDFSVCMAAFDADTEEYHFGEEFWTSAASKTLYFNHKTRYPLNSLLRVGKYTSKGYYFPKSETVKMALTAIQNGMPTSWDELEAAIGGTYGRQIKLATDDLEFSFENAIELLDSIVFEFHQTDDGKYSNIKAEDLDLFFSGEDIISFTFERDQSPYAYGPKEMTVLIRDNKLTSLSSNEKKSFEMLGIKMQTEGEVTRENLIAPKLIQASPDLIMYGYKILEEMGDGSYQNVINQKKLTYTLGKTTEQPESPHIFLFPSLKETEKKIDRSKYGMEKNKNKRICKFSFQLKDLRGVTSTEYKVTQAKLEEVIKETVDT